MSNVLDELEQLNNDVEWLHTNYRDLINQYNEEFVTIKNRKVIEHNKDLQLLKEKLKEKGIEASAILIEFIKDKSKQIS
jgi:Family of unknown function (DUF5678)